ncbi:MAG: hypothetical protein ACTHNS_15365 [Marmoricola sp.]
MADPVEHEPAHRAVPVPDLERVFLNAASSPVLPLADALHDVFDAVTGTFRVLRPDPVVA